MQELDLKILQHYDLLSELRIIDRIEELEQTRHFLGQLLLLARELGRKLSVDETLQLAIQGAFEILNANQVIIIVPRTVDCSHYRMRVFNTLHEDGDLRVDNLSADGHLLKALDALEGRAVKWPKFLEDHPEIAEDEAFAKINPEMIVPMRHQKVLLGAMMVSEQETHRGSATNVRRTELLEHIAALTALSIENARLYQLVNLDKKSRLHSYEYFRDMITQEFNKAMRYSTALSLLMIDIDEFKGINDSYGHRVGDFVIQYVGRIIRAEIRNVDIAARYGGEEFSVLLPMTNSNGAYTVAERIRRSMAEQRFKLPSGESFRVTISLGVVTFQNRNIGDPDKMIDLADKALYASKSAGRNTTTIAKLESGSIALAVG